MTAPSFADQLTHAADTVRLRGRLERLAAEWKEQSRYLSNTAWVAMLPAYQRVIGRGRPSPR